MDKSALGQAEAGFLGYLNAYPQGVYATSAHGLLRRVHWLADDNDKLAEDFAWQLTQATDAQRNVSVDELVEEADLKLLMVNSANLKEPLLQTVTDLMLMRANTPPRLTREALAQQKATFANTPALYDYLQAAFALYVEHQPTPPLKHLPQDMPSNLDYFAFSQQTLRALALEEKGLEKRRSTVAETARLRPSCHCNVTNWKLALAMNYERSGQLAKVFASDSPITAKQVRYILLRNVAGPEVTAPADRPGQRSAGAPDRAIRPAL